MHIDKNGVMFPDDNDKFEYAVHGMLNTNTPILTALIDRVIALEEEIKRLKNDAASK